MSVAIFAALVLASLFLILWLAQERIVFQPPADYSVPDSKLARRVEYRASDGQTLVGFLVEPADPAVGVLICFHGNADLAAWQIEWGREAGRRTCHSIFLAEYRGYFGLGGKPTYQSTRLDSHAAYQAALKETQLPPSSVSLFGHSLGSAVAAELAVRLPVRALLLQAPFTSARAMGRLVIGRPLLLLWSRLSRVHFDTEHLVRSLSIPVSVAHGVRDRIVPSRMGKAVHAAAQMKGDFLLLPDAGHNDIPKSGAEAYWRWISDSLASRPKLVSERDY